MDLLFNPEVQIVLKVAFASLLGMLVGLERELVYKPTGMRTHMFICMSTCLITSLGIYMDTVFFPPLLGKVPNVDPARIIQAIVIGVGFIGAGTIMQLPGKGRVVYLTSAASILLSAAIGIAVALSLYIVATACVIYVWIINRAIRYLDKKLLNRHRQKVGQSLEDS